MSPVEQTRCLVSIQSMVTFDISQAHIINLSKIIQNDFLVAKIFNTFKEIVVAEYNDAIAIYQPDVVAMVAKIWEFHHKVSYILAYIRDKTESCALNGGFEVRQFNGVIDICRPTLVAMVTKISEYHISFNSYKRFIRDFYKQEHYAVH